tara:strand:+ start:8295 stop:9668 length:1374 start_codon:yes stop_codon:yes gene_type:complete
MSIKSFSDFLTEQSKEVTFVFGRFNPPTIGHEKLFDALKKHSRGGIYRIYASKSVDNKKNPLIFKDKVKFLRKMFPKHARNVMADMDVRNVLDIAVKLYDQGFTKITMVAGSDRLKEFDILLNKYNGKKAKHGFYNFEGSINIVNAGERDPDAEGAAGMSASKMRAAAQQNDLQLFAKGLPSNFSPTELFNAVRKGMGLKESHNFRNHIELTPVSETREEYIEGSLYKVGDTVKIKKTNEVGKIVVCGTNYIMVEANDVKKRLWLDDVVEYNELGTDSALKKYLKDTPFSKFVKEKEDPDIGKRKGSQPAGYYKGLGKSTKSKRAAQFAKQSKMDDDNPAAYKPAPGDATAKTKPSKHTKKFKQMYGEMAEHLTFEDFVITEQDTKKALQKKAEKSGMPYGILKKVFDRGVAAWRTGHRPGTTAVQWGLARVNSFVTKSKGTWGKADKDLAAKVRGS